jgi:hypothetical protein
MYYAPLGDFWGFTACRIKNTYMHILGSIYLEAFCCADSPLTQLHSADLKLKLVS